MEDPMYNVAISVVLAAATFGLVALLLSPVAAIIPALMVFAVAWWLLSRRIAKQVEEEMKALVPLLQARKVDDTVATGIEDHEQPAAVEGVLLHGEHQTTTVGDAQVSERGELRTARTEDEVAIATVFRPRLRIRQGRRARRCRITRSTGPTSHAGRQWRTGRHTEHEVRSIQRVGEA